MSEPTAGAGAFVDWLRDNVVHLDTLDPDGPLDDLEPLRDVVGAARVVAIGENAHFIREFTQARQRILRFLVERCGFTAFAFEFGFSEGFALDRWVRDGAGVDLATVSEAAAAWGAGDLLRHLRGLTTGSGRPVRFVGIDIPEAGGSLLPALQPVAEYLRDVDADALPALDAAIATAEKFAGKSGASAAPAWAGLATAEQDALTAALARLLLRFRGLRPLYVERGGQHDYDVALRRLEAAGHADYMLRAMNGLFTGTGLPGDMSVRDRFMADSVRWHLEHGDPETRIVLAAHNNHIQRAPVSYGGVLTTLPMGLHLDRALGGAYLPIAVTSTADRTAEMRLDSSAPAGFAVVDAALPPPEPGSVEAAALAAEVRLGLVDLRRAPAAVEGLDRIRSQSDYMRTPLAEAFDAVVVVPTATLAVPSL
ncbi:erythromycin esterase family protein [Phytohabitans sp. ZYX-F-186]|uniref:Erythromycin esterase family protein n=1 Tax=Phytohabitans maris TaxID=3071409 RepID=A0ABU0ZDB0_9ACTN|nr:erythromycin esterase family protein [Phytohabitans sp. ZYX-F-186]MDQ7904419.1 erythromycin esterase family protein [Phytohabitans sp. ZYX-F-186]